MYEVEEIRKEIVGQMSMENIMRETKYIAERFPWRLSGTPIAYQAGKYYVDYLKSHGVSAELLKVTGYLNIPGEAKLKVVAPIEEDIFCRPCAQCGSTPAGGISAELVFIGAGGESDYLGKDVKGKIVLAEVSYAPPRPEKTRLAIAHGAAGMILMNWGTDNNEWLGNGTVKPVWGNPTPETISLMDNTPPVMSITRKVGVRLRDMVLSGKKVVISMDYQTTREWMPLYIPYAEVKAENGNGEFILVTGHMDAWAQGASDNASGNAIKLELARVLQQNRHLLKRDVRFAFWQGHENGIMEGSTWFVEKFWDELDEHCVAHFSIDTSGLWKASVWYCERAPETAEWVKEIDKATIPQGTKIIYSKVKRTGDLSFFGMGIPSNSTWMYHTQEEIARWNNAILGEYYHSDGDTMEFIDPQVLDMCRIGACSYIADIIARRVLPMNFTPLADQVITRLSELQEIIKDREDAKELLELDKAMEIAKKFRTKTVSLEMLRKAIELDETCDASAINNSLRMLSRTTMAMLCTVTGRYEQDTYGLSALNYVIPGSESIIKLIEKSADSHEYYLWSTRARRERNKVTDALRHSIDICNEILGC